MYICYLDESGTPELSHQSDHFVYLGVAIPAETWKSKDHQLNEIKAKYNLLDVEIHTAWMTRKYPEQEGIPKFACFSQSERVKLALKERDNWLAVSAVKKNAKQLKDIKKNYKMTFPYLHLTREERLKFLKEVANLIGTWQDTRIFCEAAKKSPTLISKSTLGGVYEDSFQQVVTRFELFLKFKSRADQNNIHGLLVADNNESLNKKLTTVMRRFHKDGTIWRDIEHIVETPMFVDSTLTSMIQIADLAAFATRRFFSNNETDLFDSIYQRFDRVKTKVVGIRHYTPGEPCKCKVCRDHEKPYASQPASRSPKR